MSGEIVIDGYSKLIHIGRGGTSTVFSAVRSSDSLPVAIKVFDHAEDRHQQPPSADDDSDHAPRPRAILLDRARRRIALLRSHLPGRERAAAAWFGPKGFASVVYGLLILDARIPLSDELFHLTALVVVASIIAHSSTDVTIAHWLTDDSKPPSTAAT